MGANLAAPGNLITNTIGYPQPIAICLYWSLSACQNEKARSQRLVKDDKLFGSVTSKDIAEAIAKHGLEVDKRKIILPEELIKRLGTHTVQVKLHPEVTADISLEVTKI